MKLMASLELLEFDNYFYYHRNLLVAQRLR